MSDSEKLERRDCALEECDHDWEYCSDDAGEFPYWEQWHWRECGKCGAHEDITARDLPQREDDDVI